MNRFRITYAETVEADSLPSALVRALNCAPRRIALDAVVQDAGVEVRVWATKAEFDAGSEPAFIVAEVGFPDPDPAGQQTVRQPRRVGRYKLK